MKSVMRIALFLTLAIVHQSATFDCGVYQIAKCLRCSADTCTSIHLQILPSDHYVSHSTWLSLCVLPQIISHLMKHWQYCFAVPFFIFFKMRNQAERETNYLSFFSASWCKFLTKQSNLQPCSYIKKTEFTGPGNYCYNLESGGEMSFSFR